MGTYIINYKEDVDIKKWELLCKVYQWRKNSSLTCQKYFSQGHVIFAVKDEAVETTPYEDVKQLFEGVDLLKYRYWEAEKSESPSCIAELLRQIITPKYENCFVILNIYHCCNDDGSVVGSYPTMKIIAYVHGSVAITGGRYILQKNREDEIIYRTSENVLYAENSVTNELSPIDSIEILRVEQRKK